MMKKNLVILLLGLLALSSRAQDTVKKSNSIGHFNEQFVVLKSDKKVRQGSYKLFLNKKLVAIGNYSAGKKVGIWNYYTNDKLEQQFDYTNNKLVFSMPDKNISYVIGTNAGDSVKNPAKLGGYAACLLMVAHTDFEDNLPTTGLSGKLKIDHVIAIDEDGKMVSWFVKIKSDDGMRVLSQKYPDLPEDAQAFIPAAVNGKLVASTFVFHDEATVAKDDKPVTTAEPTRSPGSRGRH